MIAAQAALTKHAEGVVIMNVAGLSSVTDCYVICTAATVRQMAAMREEIEDMLRQHGQRLWHVEGPSMDRHPNRNVKAQGGNEPPREGEELQWVLMDCGDVVVHLFNPPARSFYQLEHLWADAPQIPLDPTASMTA